MKIIYKVGMRIKDLREARGMSQLDFAHHARIDRTYATSIENGDRNVTMERIEQIAHALGVSVGEFFHWDGFYNRVPDGDD